MIYFYLKPCQLIAGCAWAAAIKATQCTPFGESVKKLSPLCSLLSLLLHERQIEKEIEYSKTVRLCISDLSEWECDCA